MADKRIFQLDDEGFLDDLTDKVYMWLDKKANEGEPNVPSWKFKANVFLKILNNFATKFVPNVATVEGKCYWHDGELYVCNVAYTGDWVPGNFVLTSVDELFARKDVLSALTTYAHNVAASVSPTFDPTKPDDAGGYAYYAGTPVMYNGSNYVFTSNKKSGAWDPSVVEKKPLSESIQLEGVGEAVSEWLNEHPEATTTVEDNSITDTKLKESIKFNVASGTGYSGRKIVDKDDDIFDVMSDTDTIYEIRWKFDLNGGTLEIPDNCAVKFNGGKFVNGTVDFNNCTIIAGEEQIFEDILPDDDCKLSQGVNIRWFGAVGDGVADDTAAVKAAISFAKKLYNRHGNTTFRNYEGVGVVVYAEKNNYFRITDQINVDFSCSIIGGFTFIYDGEKVANEGAVNIYKMVSYCSFDFGVIYGGAFDYSDGTKFYGVVYGSNSERSAVENCNITHHIKGFYGGIKLMGIARSYVTGCNFKNCIISYGLYGITLTQNNGAWHNSNRFDTIWFTNGTSGYTVPVGFTKSAAFLFDGDGSYFPNSLVFEKINIEGYPLNSASCSTLLFLLDFAAETYGSVGNWSIGNIRVENVNTGNILESNVPVTLNKISIYGPLYGVASSKMLVKGIAYPVSSSLNEINSQKSSSGVFSEIVTSSELKKKVINAGYGYRSSSDIFFNITAGIADLNAAYTSTQEDKLNRFYALPHYAYILAPQSHIKIDFDRVGASLSKVLVYDASGIQIAGADIPDYVSTTGSNVRVDDNGYRFNSPDEHIMYLYNKGNSDILICPLSDGGGYTIYGTSLAKFTSSTSYVPFSGAEADMPAPNRVRVGFEYSIINSSVVYKKYQTQTGNSYWKNISPIRYSYGTSSQRPSSLNNNTDIGYQYYDTTLGLPIVWNGSKWKKYDGTDADAVNA